MTRLSAGSDRFASVRVVLMAKRKEIEERVQNRLRDIRGDGAAKEPQTAFEEVQPGTQTELRLTEIELRLTEIEATMLAKVLEALKRLDEGTFGKCCDCNDDVPEKRLRALPFAVRCTDCQERMEQQDKVSKKHDRRDQSRETWMRN